MKNSMVMFSRNEVKAVEKGYYVDKSGNAMRANSNKILGTSGNRKYRYIGLKENGKSIKVYIHRLQAYLKFGDKIYMEGIQVRHLNGNLYDNSFDNIEIGTGSENIMDIPEHVRVRCASKANKKYSDEIVLEIRKLHEQGVPYKELMKRFNIGSKGTMSSIVNKRILL